MAHESMEFDFIIVGAGVAGLSAAIRLSQLALKQQQPCTICVLEKGAEVGAHILSGAAIETKALDELIPDWQAKGAPLHTPVTEDWFMYFTEKKAFRLPTPPQMRNDGNYIISLSQFCRWLAQQAESLGVNIFPGFAATDVILRDNTVCGVVTGDMGIDKNGNKTSRYQPGIELYAKQVILAEGCRGSLAEKIIKKYALRSQSDPQTYGLGIKELWEIPKTLHRPGKVLHSFGWPLDRKTYGGSFVYHFDKNLLAIGFVVGLDYQNPYLNPYEEFQRFKTHPTISPLLQNSKRIAYGARALNEGGFQSIPDLSFPGGVLIGCAAGFLNVPKIKGTHNAMKSGMVAAESLYQSIQQNQCTNYTENMKKSWVWDELYRARNIRPAFQWGLLPGLCYSAIDTYLLRGKAPWTFHHHADFAQLKFASTCKKLAYPKHDNRITFDLLSSVFLTHTKHEENQPCHLKLKDPAVAIKVNFTEYAAPETRYCPAGVYEIVYDEKNAPRLHINAANCIQCKACDIKDPTQNITWTPPEGGSGPQYRMM